MAEHGRGRDGNPLRSSPDRPTGELGGFRPRHTASFSNPLLLLSRPGQRQRRVLAGHAASGHGGRRHRPGSLAGQQRRKPVSSTHQLVARRPANAAQRRTSQPGTNPTHPDLDRPWGPMARPGRRTRSSEAESRRPLVVSDSEKTATSPGVQLLDHLAHRCLRPAEVAQRRIETHGTSHPRSAPAPRLVRPHRVTPESRANRSLHPLSRPARLRAGGGSPVVIPRSWRALGASLAGCGALRGFGRLRDGHLL